MAVLNEKSNKPRTHHKKTKTVTSSTTTTSLEESRVKYFNTYNFVLIVTAIVITVLHRNHVSGMFESDRHFSHLSTLERELTFRTEMGLYYSYFKTITEAPTFWNGLSQVMFDNVTEYPLVINTLKRFNLYPEVLLGAAYRIYDEIMFKLGKPTKTCFKVNRGDNLSPVQSCEGLGEKPYFYIESVFLLNGISMGLFFLFGWYLSESYLGGLLTVLCFFYNHGECTRVQWTPPLRESFAYPFLVLQMFIVTYTIKSSKISNKNSVAIACSTMCFMLPWQFAQFALLMQTLSVFATYLLGFIGSQTVKVIAGGQLLGLIMSAAFLFGNEMLVTSFFSSALVAIWLILSVEKHVQKMNLPRVVVSIIQGMSLVVMTIGVKIIISKLLNITDDEHIGDIFRGKFSDFKNFHSMLYVCAPEFDFMEKATPVRLTKTLLLPCSLFVLCVIFYRVIFAQLKALFTFNKSGSSVKQNGRHHSNHANESKNGVGKHHHTKEQTSKNDETQEIPSKTTPMNSLEHAELVYHFFQLATYSAMAIVIMRLKLFWTPHLCLITSLLASYKFFSWFGNRTKHMTILACIVAIMSYQGISNLQQQWSIQGEFSNIQLEQLVDWINEHTDKNAVFAGPMPLMATIKLCTGRPIVNHPHYEDAGLRNRTRMVYLMFSRKDTSLVWSVYKDMGIHFLIVEEQWCLRRSKPGCGMTDLWDMEDKDNLGRDAVCKRLYNDPSPYFQIYFKNDVYHVFRIVDNPIKIYKKFEEGEE